MKGGRRLPGYASALVLGTLPAFASPAPSWWWLAWVGVVPLLLAVRAAATPADGAVRAWCGLTGYVVTTEYWLLPSAGPLIVAMAAGIGACWLPWGWAAQRLLSSPVTTPRLLAALVVLPSAWVSAETVRSWPGLGGPWASLGASQWNQPVTLASAALGGVWLTSFLVMAVNTGIVGALVHARPRGRVIALAAVLACAGLGPAWYTVRAAPPVDSTARVALVQPGVVDDSAARTAANETLTAALSQQRPDLVVWGESSVGVDPAGHPDTVRRLAELSRRVGAYLLVNVDAQATSGAIYKSSVLIGPDGILGAYRKTRLVPFGEYVPLRPVLGWFTRHTKAADVDRQRGSGPVVLHAGSLDIGPLISFEAIFADLPRRQVQLGARLLVYQSSTSTFQGSWAQPQLAAIVAVRAAEEGHSAVHTGSSGVSAAFDAAGHRLAWCPAGYRGAIVVSVPLESSTTLYRQLGDWVATLAFSILASAGMLALLRSCVSRRGSCRGVDDQHVNLGPARHVGGHRSQEPACDGIQADVADDEQIGVDLLGESDKRVDRSSDD